MIYKNEAFTSNIIFPYQDEHVHGSTIVELPNGDLLSAWFQGSGERWADDVKILGSRLAKGDTAWSKTFCYGGRRWVSGYQPNYVHGSAATIVVDVVSSVSESMGNFDPDVSAQ